MLFGFGDVDVYIDMKLLTQSNHNITIVANHKQQVFKIACLLTLIAEI